MYTQYIKKDSSGTIYFKDREMTILHREDGPAIEFSSGTKRWYLNGKCHREDGPAIEFSSGGKEWFVNNKRHREDGPAIECSGGTKHWCLNGKYHREDGPAIEFPSGEKRWFLNDKEVSEEEHKKLTTIQPTVNIEGCFCVRSRESYREYELSNKTEQYIKKNIIGTFYFKDKEMTILHREDGPAAEYLEDGTKAWFINGKRHRKDGPAVERLDGTKTWYINGKCHREDGPAMEYPDGAKFWYLNDKRHREDGPAIEWPKGNKAWFLNGKEVTEEEHKRLTTKEPTVTIEGKQFTIQQLKDLIETSK